MSSAEQPRGLEGEDLATTHWEDARHWIAIYADLLRFKTGLLERVRREIPNLLPVAQIEQRQVGRAEKTLLALQEAFGKYVNRYVAERSPSVSHRG